MNLESIKRRLLVKYPFFGSVVASSNFIAEKSVRTAETDGQNIYYNPDFIESVTNDQQTFIFAHEICHIAFDHIYRSEGKDEKLWNIATDAVINAFLKQDKLPMVEGVIDIPEAINFDAEEMYKKLLSEKNQQSNQSQNGNSQKQEGNQSNGGSSKTSNKEEKQQDVGHDTHSMWTKAVEKKHQEGQNHHDKKQNKEQENKTNEEIKKLTKLGEKETFKQNKIERKKQLEGIFLISTGDTPDLI
jgi:predicted metal-dependent peptidase